MLKKKLAKPKLSNRMKIFIEKALPSYPFWDVCCDHGYIGIGALESLKFSEVHFVDQVPHIMDRLKKLIYQSPALNPDYTFFFHTKSGEEISQDVTGTLLIAGVGGTTIKKILDSLCNQDLLKADRLLLSPHLDENIMLSFLAIEKIALNYTSFEKISIQEGRRIRPLYIVDKIKK